jgi:undecaprenyl diphosphate synthase
VSLHPPITSLSPAGIAALEAIRIRSPKARPHEVLPDVCPSRLPRHVAVIMDGNGRWASDRSQPRMLGHRAGAKSVRSLMETVGDLGIECITLYSFSMDNWKRPQAEVEALMHLYLEYMAIERPALMDNNIRFRQIGRSADLPPIIQEGVAALEAATAHHTSATLCLAVNYASRAEITDATRAIARKVASGELSPDDITEDTISASLYAPDVPDPDLLIRTAGEMRLSNYLLWQISYAELYVTPTLWPDFGREQFLDAIREYSRRSRRFGGLAPAAT